MAPPPEYDKEPKAPDKSVINISNDESRVRYTNVKDQPLNSETKTPAAKGNIEAENNIDVETLDDGQLRALLDEAITYKCPKDREGKSNLFKELLEEVEQDEQCEAAARVTVSGRGRVGRRGRHEHHSSLQDLVAAMAAESAPRRSRVGHAHSHHGPPAASVSARAHHGGSLPSGVDTSFLMSEEPARGGYLATVRCVNPPPLAERRVSASEDAPPDAELDLLTRRSKPSFPMTYTARATLEIGSGSVSSGRAVTTTTASNQVRTNYPTRGHRYFHPSLNCHQLSRLPTCGPPEKIHRNTTNFWTPNHVNKRIWGKIKAKTNTVGIDETKHIKSYESYALKHNYDHITCDVTSFSSVQRKWKDDDRQWNRMVDNWYGSFGNNFYHTDQLRKKVFKVKEKNYESETFIDMLSKDFAKIDNNGYQVPDNTYIPDMPLLHNKISYNFSPRNMMSANKESKLPIIDKKLNELRKAYREKVGYLTPPNLSIINEKNVRNLTIAKSIDQKFDESKIKTYMNLESSMNLEKISESKCINDSGKIFIDPTTVKTSVTSTLEHNISQTCQDNAFSVKTRLKSDNSGSTVMDLNNFKTKLHLNRQVNDNYKLGEKKLSRGTVIIQNKSSTEPIIPKPTSNDDKLQVYESIYKKKRILNEVLDADATTELGQVDSAIPFSCITTPEIVSSCNTTTSTTQSDAVDLKSLQLSTSYRAVASLMGEASRAASPPAPRASAPPVDATALATPQQPHGVVSSSFNGLAVARPAYASAADEHKVPILTVHYRLQKSLDENGNAVQGFSSPPSGSSQPKKPRRKKSSKNETVIKSHQIDGYQGNKDLNEVLRFIESNADGARGNKLGRAKHKDDSDDKNGKKRSTERRKDKENKIKRATSMEELSRTKLEDLTDNKPPLRGGKPRWPDAPPAKAERRSWGEDARTTLLLSDDTRTDDTPAVEPDPAAELTDFQTVTKKRKPRRRTDETEREPAADLPRRARPPSPRARRISAPPSDRSNDSNDDMDSVHSLPAAPPPPPVALAHVSYADIARTRHNIPDLIESCNFYGEEEEPRPEDGIGSVTQATGTDADQYPALTTVRRLRDKTSTCTSGAAPSAKEREAPAPDVVSDRRPPVILLDSTGRGRDMDGVTFGFDIDEQLLGRADVVRDAEAGAGVGAGGVAVRVACGPLRYVPPRETHAPQIHLIVDYVGSAWEDIVKCGSAKVKYYSD